jgi:hypothetical protein
MSQQRSSRRSILFNCITKRIALTIRLKVQSFVVHAFSLRFLASFVILVAYAALGTSSSFGQPGRAAGAFRNSQQLHLQFSGEQQPLAMVTGDFDEDGVGDLVIGYATTKGGSIAVLHGNLDAHAPQTKESWLAAGKHQYSDPYSQISKPIATSSQPGLMVAADVNGDGHLDLVFVTHGSNQISVMFGDGKGSFLSPKSTNVGGGITALAAYRPGAPFTEEMIVAGYESGGKARLSILTYSAKSFAEQATYVLPDEAIAMSVANLDADSVPDAAIVAGDQLLILHGKAALSGKGALTTVPISDVRWVTEGRSFSIATASCSCRS